ncbi:hypothetical protein DDB_G0273179 [Dictyostelium discoideum AX4]|uniref:Ankyrin repeat-containing protein n=1 Tax=Dictyostelium discoideum TaxID=44689 RepID=Q556U3_DICDI|nr:hypothetical protein DDB_G0273819 [Dictyostelium discoideum AX4]XP_644724.1 hypothetical protein DDB_G0273179 [Dictyostelium discoideum AX4]EAL70600.1 hypothetical protein DDB_G0273819 [Dictyostelium discoideum AX4]EAL70807.1 hypothetical protein DDB_G0273179 [Dictyostelium discoideum AX4]|eukprot:XP_644526.1 hypothetical protein DDB_G0273819 [Dictyostelium discoideum AX4]
MDYQLFKKVFNNKYLRNKIFESVSIINKENKFIVKKFNQCGVKWIVMNNHFQLLIYIFKIQANKRKQLTYPLLQRFLEFNQSIEILKILICQVPSFFENLTPIQQFNNSQSLFSSMKSKNELIIKYLIEEKSFEITKISIDFVCCQENYQFFKYLLLIDEKLNKNNNNNNNKNNNLINNSNFQQINLVIKFNDFEFFKELIEKSNNVEILKNYLKNEDTIVSIIKTCGNNLNLEFIKFIFQMFNNEQLKLTTTVIIETIKFGSFDLLKLLLENQDYFSNKFSSIKTSPFINKYCFLYLLVYRCDKEILDYYCKKLNLFNNTTATDDEDDDLSLKETIGDIEVYEKLSNFKNGKTCIISFIGDISSNICYDHNQSSLEMMKYLSGNQYFNSIFTITTTVMDNALFSGRFDIFNWLVKNGNQGCSDKGFHFCCRNMPQYRFQLATILEKFRSNFSDDVILNSISSNDYFRLDKKNHNYLSSFLPQHLKPDFPMEYTPIKTKYL